MKTPIQTTLAASAFAIAASLIQGCSSPKALQNALEPHAIVLNDYEAARSAAAAEGRLLLVNSTGHSAGNARIMEVRTFQDPLVAEALTQFVEARLYSDAADPIAREANLRVIDEVVRGRAVPAYVALHPTTGKELGRCNGARFDAAEFARFLNEAAALPH